MALWEDDVTTIGIGTDIVEVARIEQLRRDHGPAFDERCFTAGERAYAARHRDGGAAQLAARFAAKEAAVKALGTGLRDGMAWTDIEIVHDPQGAPVLQVSGQVREQASRKGIVGWMVSMSHGRDYAVAVVIALGADR